MTVGFGFNSMIPYFLQWLPQMKFYRKFSRYLDIKSYYQTQLLPKIAAPSEGKGYVPTPIRVPYISKPAEIKDNMLKL